jgi:hypothetical protein
MAEVPIWEGEFRPGSIPRLCVKSGKTADASLTFEFATDAWMWIMFVGPIGGRHARAALPLTRRWRRIFVVLRSIEITTGLAAVIALFSTAAFTEAARPTVVGFARNRGSQLTTTRRGHPSRVKVRARKSRLRSDCQRVPILESWVPCVSGLAPL